MITENHNLMQVFSNDTLNMNVRTMYTENGEILINAEDTAIGFGWVQTKKGQTYVRWESINKFITELGFSQRVGKEDFIPESLFYMLGMKAKNEIAQNFQMWLATEVIPSIRKHGAYIPETGADTDYLKFAYGNLYNTFFYASSDIVDELYNQAMEFYSNNDNRLEYYKSESAKKRKDKRFNANKKYSITDTKIIISDRIKAALEDKIQDLVTRNRFGSVYEVEQTLHNVKDNIKKINDNKNRGKLADSTRKNNILQKENDILREENEKLSPIDESDFVTIRTHRIFC